MKQNNYRNRSTNRKNIPSKYKLSSLIAALIIVIVVVIGQGLWNKNQENSNGQNNDNYTSGQTVSKEYRFRSNSLLKEHFKKHGAQFDYTNAKEYETGASNVINSPDALHKTEAEDGDYVYYIESTNEFVILSKDGYIRTYFKPDNGIRYYEKQ